MTPEERILALERQLQALEIQERDMHLRRLQLRYALTKLRMGSYTIEEINAELKRCGLEEIA